MRICTTKSNEKTHHDKGHLDAALLDVRGNEAHQVALAEVDVGVEWRRDGDGVLSHGSERSDQTAGAVHAKEGERLREKRVVDGREGEKAVSLGLQLVFDAVLRPSHDRKCPQPLVVRL